jgi:hypothetical protein
MGDHFRFGSVFTRKKQPNRKKKRPETEPEPAGSGLVSVLFFGLKTGQTYRLILGFFGLLMGF